MVERYALSSGRDGWDSIQEEIMEPVRRRHKRKSKMEVRLDMNAKRRRVTTQSSNRTQCFLTMAVLRQQKEIALKEEETVSY